MLVYVSYQYHAYLKSRPKIKCSYWMEHGKTFCNIFVIDVDREKIPGFVSKKKTKKTFDWFWFSHFKSVFVSYNSCLVQSIFKKKVDHLLKLTLKRIPIKTTFFVLVQLKEGQVNSTELAELAESAENHNFFSSLIKQRKNFP